LSYLELMSRSKYDASGLSSLCVVAFLHIILL
jgi:hypothetical protein